MGNVTRNLINAYTLCSSLITVIPIGVTLLLCVLQERPEVLADILQTHNGLTDNTHLVYRYIYVYIIKGGFCCDM